MQAIVERVKIFEGFSLKPYQCSRGKWTIGYGYNYQDRGFKTETLTEILNGGFTKELAERLLKDDVENCIKQAEGFFGFFKELNHARQAVVADMLYQLGVRGFSAFKKVIKALDGGDFVLAAKEMESSRWYGQSGRRGRINTAQMKTGIWQEVK